MSSSNILRLLRDALALNKERLDLASGQVISIRPATDDTGAINIGDGDYDIDLKVFLGSTGEYVLFDVGNSQLTLACPLSVTGNVTMTGDVAVTGATTSTDTVLAAEHGAGAIGTAFAPRTSRRTVNGTIITEIKIDLTGLASKNTADDAIGLAAGGAAYIGRNVVATNGVIYRAEMICVETPAGGDNDINLVAGSAATDAYDGAVTGAAVVLNCGDHAAGMLVASDTPKVTANHYFYLTAGTGDTAAAYTAGQFIIRLYGHALMS